MPVRYKTLFSAIFIAFASVILAGTAPAFADRRVALVVGNSKYVNVPTLINPANDAKAVAAKLKQLGFEVKIYLDLDRLRWPAIREEFERDASTSDAALFFYAGHAMQYQGRNYLVPTDAVLGDETSFKYHMVPVDLIKEDVGKVGVSIFVIDACRDDPFANSSVRSLGGARSLAGDDDARGATRGMRRLDRPKGTATVWATALGEAAEDGKNTKNSPFTSALLSRLDEPGVPIDRLFQRVSGDVIAKTRGKQNPELQIAMANDFYLNQAENDEQAYARVRQSRDINEIEEFIKRFSVSTHIPDAKLLLRVLTADNQRKVETDRAAEAQRTADTARAAEAQRTADAARAAEAQRTADTARAAEAQRTADAARAAEAQRSADAAPKDQVKQSKAEFSKCSDENNARKIYVTLQQLEAQQTVAFRVHIQQILTDRGYFKGVADGKFDASTREAIKHFQADVGARQLTGYVGFCELQVLETEHAGNN